MFIQEILGIIAIIVLFIFLILYKNYQKSGKSGEKNTLKIIRKFLKNNHYQSKDYYLVSNLILQKEKYWSCEIDILLLTKKWIYIIEVKDWKRGRLSGNFNHEYLERSYQVGKQRKYQRHQMYSPFYQNEQHIKRFKSYFSLFNQPNILGIVVFNSPYLDISLQTSKKSIFENKHVFIRNSWDKNVSYWLADYESKNTQLNFFQQLKEKLVKEITSSNKSQKHRAWVKSVKEKKALKKKRV